MSRDAPPTSTASDFHVGDPGLPVDILVADDGLHGVLRGTSQATPMVAGTIALLLEASPTLTTQTIRELLRTSASPIAGTAGFSARVGFGGIGVPAALALLQGVRGGAVSPSLSSVGLTHDLLPPGSEETTLVTVTPRDAAGVPLGPGHEVSIELTGAGAALGPVRDVGAGRYERSFVAHAKPGTSGLVNAVVDGVALDAQPVVWFVRSRVDIGGHFVAGNGCSTVPSHGAGNPVALLLVLLVGFRRRAFRVLALANSAIRAALS